jgi:hypothetical protein
MELPKDIRLYAKFTLDFSDHPKIMPLSDAAFRCLIEATLWSRRQMTDGLLSRRLALARWSPEVLDELSTNDPVNPSLIEVEEGWFIHDFAQHQTTSDEIDALRATRKRAGRLGGLAKAEANRQQKLQQKASKTYPETETETETLKKELASQVPKKAAAGTRLPDGWRPPDAVIAQMRSDHPHVDLKAEHEKFADYWAGIPGARGRKCDWAGTWRNWIRRADEQTRRNGATKTKTDKGMSYVKLAEQLADRETNNQLEA